MFDAFQFSVVNYVCEIRNINSNNSEQKVMIVFFLFAFFQDVLASEMK